MPADPRRVAYLYLTADAVQDAASVKSALDATGRLLDDLRLQAELMERLIAKGEARRLGRTADIHLRSVRFDGKQINADVQGTTGDYQTRITLRPKPGHHCTCPDWQRNGQRVGPCKHVLKLGEHWRDERVVPALNLMHDELASLLTRVEV